MDSVSYRIKHAISLLCPSCDGRLILSQMDLAEDDRMYLVCVCPKCNLKVARDLCDLVVILCKDHNTQGAA